MLFEYDLAQNSFVQNTVVTGDNLHMHPWISAVMNIYHNHQGNHLELIERVLTMFYFFRQ